MMYVVVSWPPTKKSKQFALNSSSVRGLFMTVDFSSDARKLPGATPCFAPAFKASTAGQNRGGGIGLADLHLGAQRPIKRI